jgi:phosphoribosyl-ATP pyrophosphohydrolase
MVGHIVVGNGVAGLIQRRADDPARSYTAAVLDSGEPAHGANAGGLVCAVLHGATGHGLVAAVLEGADSAGEVAALLEAQPQPMARPVTLLCADEDDVLTLTVGPEGVEVTTAAVEDDADADLPALLASLRAAEPSPQPGATPAAGLAVLLGRGEPPALHVALGPPSCSVFIRYWPGMELTPEVSAAPEGAPLARLAAAVAQTTGTDPELRRAARDRLDRAEAEALREGREAERMAALMDEHTDDRGAAVRRLVAQAHAAELARHALEELAVPAPIRGRAGPRL